ncbi:MAG: FAD-binding oxidoreductase [Gammaproteobacteria bacterium]|nr:FAD-binding oxidoreductase [Gammaproteobacteria bacterium]MBP9764305.1 FAD-binding oxidoreductase [Gammaproteobacteria bacterium]
MKVDIIGGGVAGCVTALELAAEGYDICIREYRPELLTGSSHATPCRLTLGFHYFDQETAFRCLEATIGFVRNYPDFKIIDRLTEATHLRKGFYFITKDSLFEPSEVRVFYEKLQGRYAQLVAQDPANEVFGLPQQFIRVLDPSEYPDQVDMDRIAIGFETAECSLDFPRFRTFLIEQIKAHPNIQVFTHEEVLKIQQADHHDGFTLMIQEPKKPETFRSVETDLIINATWECIEALNEVSGFPMKAQRTMRTKVMIEVKLPPSLEQAHSMFFGFGAHASFTNLGPSPEGYSRGFITFEPVTNLEKTTDLTISERSRRLLYEGGTAEEKALFAEQIIGNIGRYYIKGMEDAQCLGVSFGIVKNDGVVDIFSLSSASHQRRETGISEQQFGWFSNASMKLLLCRENALQMVGLVKLHEKALGNIHSIAQQTAEKHFPKEGGPAITHLFVKYLQQATHKRRLDIASAAHISHFYHGISSLAERKKAVHEELLQPICSTTSVVEPPCAKKPSMVRAPLQFSKEVVRKSQSSPDLVGRYNNARSISPLR